MNSRASSGRRTIAGLMLLLGASAAALSLGCASQPTGPNGTSAEARNGATVSTAGLPVVPTKKPTVERVDPFAGVSAPAPVGLVALRAELERAMKELKGKANPPPYFISYQVFDRNETIISASYG